jgi:hypothetical protein
MNSEFWNIFQWNSNGFSDRNCSKSGWELLANRSRSSATFFLCTPHGWSQLVSPRFKISQQNIALREHKNIERQRNYFCPVYVLKLIEKTILSVQSYEKQVH